MTRRSHDNDMLLWVFLFSHFVNLFIMNGDRVDHLLLNAHLYDMLGGKDFRLSSWSCNNRQCVILSHKGYVFTIANNIVIILFTLADEFLPYGI